MSRNVAGLVLLLILAGVSWLGVAGIGVPAPVPASAPAGAFSAERALEHVRTLAAGPRPVGTEAHARARSYLVERLRALGLDPEVQRAVGRSRWGGAFGTVENVLARVEGGGAGSAVLLLAHYDSVPSGPGASDDAVGVAVLLETLRALQADPPRRHDVIALFSDAEEAGLMGAEAFLHDHPWAEDVAVVLNFEARGTRGPSLMFETGGDNLWLIRRFAAAAPHPVASSYSYEVYRRLPNDTDFSVFRDREIPGLNFAHIHGAVGYHTAQDSVERLDPGSLQHHGANALALTRELADADLSAAAAARGDAVYFNPWGSSFVWFPASWVPVLLAILGLAAVVVLVLAVRNGRVRVPGLLAGFVFWAAAVAVLGVLGAVARGLIFPVPYDFRIWGDGSSLAWGLFGWTLAAFGVAVALYLLVRRWIAPAGLAAGGLLLWLVVSAAGSLLAPGASYLFLVPLAAQLLAFGWLFGRGGAPEQGTDRVPVLGWTLLALAGAVAALVWAPTLALVGVGLQLGAVAVLGALGVLVLGLLSLQVDLATAPRPRWALPLVLVAAGVVLVVAVQATAGFGEGSPRPTSLFYALDADDGRAVWGSFERRLSPWTEAMLPAEPERVSLASFLGRAPEVATGPAPVLDLPVPEVEVVEAPAGGSGSGRYRVRVTPPPGTHRLRLTLEPASDLRSITIQGREAELPEDDEETATFVYLAPPAEGVEVVLETAGETAPELAAVAQWFRLPAVTEGGPPARGPGLMQTGYGWDSDTTMVRASYRLAAEGEVREASVSPAGDFPVE